MLIFVSLALHVIIHIVATFVLMCIAGKNQVDTFLEQHMGPGIQHIGLYTQDIVSTAHTMAEAGVQFFSPPPAYYTEVCLFHNDTISHIN